MATEKRMIDMNVAIERARASDNIVGSSIWETCEVVEFLEDCPIVDAVEVVHGRWVRKAHDGAFGVFHLWHCSVCDTIRARQDPCCGECGAKMDGGADNG